MALFGRASSGVKWIKLSLRVNPDLNVWCEIEKKGIEIHHVSSFSHEKFF